MRYAQIDAGHIVNVIVSDAHPGVGYVADPDARASPGGTWTEAGGFAPPPAAPESVPERVEMWQARAALRVAGIYEAADAAIAASGNPALIEAWSNGNSFRRDSPAIGQLGAALGLSAAQIDDLFRSAAGIAV